MCCEWVDAGGSGDAHASAFLFVSAKVSLKNPTPDSRCERIQLLCER